jgi:hypothetical protein
MWYDSSTNINFCSCNQLIMSEHLFVSVQTYFSVIEDCHLFLEHSCEVMCWYSIMYTMFKCKLLLLFLLILLLEYNKNDIRCTFNLKILYVVIKVVNHTKWNYIYVHNYAIKTIFKHPRICKICTANICAYYMQS